MNKRCHKCGGLPILTAKLLSNGTFSARIDCIACKEEWTEKQFHITKSLEAYGVLKVQCDICLEVVRDWDRRQSMKEAHNG